MAFLETGLRIAHLRSLMQVSVFAFIAQKDRPFSAAGMAWLAVRKIFSSNGSSSECASQCISDLGQELRLVERRRVSSSRRAL